MQRRNTLLPRGSKSMHPSRRILLISGIILTLLFTAFLEVRSTVFAENVTDQPAAAAPATTAVTTYHNDNLRTGQNSHETILTSGNVKSSQFGKRVTYTVDGQVYAQPLYLPNVSIRGTVHNVVYVATENDSVYAFNAKTEDQRSALLLSNGVVYISWASFGDTDPYHGWVIGYHYTGSALQQVAVYNGSPNGSEGGIWMSGDGPAADSSGNVYLITGNGSYNLNSGGPNAGDSFLKLSTQSGLSVSDYFTPFNQSCLSAADADLGSGGELLLPDQTNTAHPHLVIGAGKEGRIYVIDRDNMGHFTNDPNLNCNSSEKNQTTSDKVLQELGPGTMGSNFASAGYWASSSQAWIYVGGVGDTLKAFRVSNDALSSSPTSRTSESFQFPGITPSISSNGNASGIAWAVSPPPSCSGNGCNPSGPGVLCAYDATNLGTELYNSAQNASRDQLDSYTKFSVPTIANGEVFVGTHTSLSIYGLLSTSGGSFNPNVHYKLVNVNSGKDLDVTGASTADGAQVVQWTDHGGTNQDWNIIAVGSSYKLVNVNSGKDLDVTGYSTADGAQVIQWTDNGGTNQQWNIVQVS